MTPDQRFALWVRGAIAAFCLLFAYFVVADTYMPLTPQARVMRPVTQVAPRISGPVVEVAVSDHQNVAAGDVLFRIDPDPFELALERARLAEEAARRDNALLAAELESARADVQAARARAEESGQERRRAERLITQGSISRQRLDGLVAGDREAEAAVSAAEAEVRRLELDLGDVGSANLRLRQARNAVEQARLNLGYTVVRADQAGTVTNLQLEEGSYVGKGTPVMAMVNQRLDLVADFREKSLRKVQAGDDARVVFDALPGRVFKARVESRDAGVRDGQQVADGRLADIPTTDRWVRDAQRLRLHLRLVEAPEGAPASGSRATVQLLPGEHPLAHPFAAVQIRLMSWLHYVY